MAEKPERKVKCAWCSNLDIKSLLTKEINKKYYHIVKCHESYLTDKNFKKKEAEAKLQMSIKIAEVYELESYKLIPSNFYPFIEDVRNDNSIYQKLEKNYKTGIPYEGISYTYEFCKDRIREAKGRVAFQNFMGELRYGLAIVRNNLVDAKNHAILQKRTKDNIVLAAKRMSEEVSGNEETTTFKSKKSRKNISEFL